MSDADEYRIPCSAKTASLVTSLDRLVDGVKESAPKEYRVNLYNSISSTASDLSRSISSSPYGRCPHGIYALSRLSRAMDYMPMFIGTKSRAGRSFEELRQYITSDLSYLPR
jgi:hypothetical protein